MHDLPPNYSYRSMALLCRRQAALSSTPDTRRELEQMALEYQTLADRLDQQSPIDQNEQDREQNNVRAQSRTKKQKPDATAGLPIESTTPCKSAGADDGCAES
jgi:hypothetical protein